MIILSLKKLSFYFINLKKTIMRQKITRASTTFILFLTVVLFLFACKNNDRNERTPEGPDTAGRRAPLATAGQFYELKLDSASLVALFSRTATMKILLQFADSGKVDAVHMRLVAHAAKQNNEIQTDPPVHLKEISSTSVWDTTGPKILGNLEISR